MYLLCVCEFCPVCKERAHTNQINDQLEHLVSVQNYFIIIILLFSLILLNTYGSLLTFFEDQASNSKLTAVCLLSDLTDYDGNS